MLQHFFAIECPACFSFQFTLEEVDITAPENKHWYKQYRYEIPVFHLQGQFLMKHRVDTKLLETKLKEHHSRMKLSES